MVAGRTALVTGAGHGLGQALVKALADAGASRVYATDAEEAAAEATAHACGDAVHALALDVTKSSDIARAADSCGDVDLLINNAGVASWSGFLSASGLDGMRHEIEVNYFGPLAMCRAFAPMLSGRENATVVNVLSVFALTCFQPLASECASKAAAMIMTQGVRAELAPKGVRVISVFPGAMDTEMTKNIPDPKQDPAEVAALTLQAVSDPGAGDDVFPHDAVREIVAEFEADRKAAERKYASFGLG